MTFVSFIYKWTDSLTGKIYIGVHKGTLDDGYICSSKYFMEEYKKRPDYFSREILEYFETYEMARLAEIKILIENNAARNPIYYNRSNGRGAISSLPETRKKISESMTGKIFRKGKILSEGHKI